MTLRGQGMWLAALAASACLAMLDLLVAYELGPAAAVLLPVGALGAVVVLRDPILGVCGAFLAIPLEPFGLQLVSAAGFSVAEIAFLTAAAGAAARLLLHGVGRPIHPAHVAFGALLVTIGCGYLVAEDKLIVTKILLMWTALGAVSILVASSDRRDLERVLASIAVAGGIVGVVAIATSGQQELVSGGTLAVGRAQASFQQPNVLGFFLSLTIPLALVLGARARGVPRAVLLASGVLAIAGLLLSLSRTSIVGTGLALIVLLAWRPFRHAAVVGIAVLGLFAIFNADALLQSRQLQVVGTRLGTLTASGAAEEDVRFTIWQRTPAIIADHPVVGVGPGNFSVVARRYGIADPDGLAFDHPHDVPLTIAAETGPFGLAAFLAFVGLVAVAARDALRRRVAPTWPLALALCAALSAAVVTGLGDYPLRTNVIMATLMVEVGALIACQRLARAEPR